MVVESSSSLIALSTPCISQDSSSLDTLVLRNHKRVAVTLNDIGGNEDAWLDPYGVLLSHAASRLVTLHVTGRNRIAPAATQMHSRGICAVPVWCALAPTA